MQSSLRRRLLLHLSGPLLAILALGAAGGYGVARHIGDLVHDHWLLDSALTLAAQVRGGEDALRLELPPPALEMFEFDRVDKIYEEVRSARRGVLLSNAQFPPVTQVPGPGQPRFRHGTIQGQPVRIVAVAVERASETVQVQVAETLRKREMAARSVMLDLLPLQAAILLLAGAAIWLAVTRNMRQLDSIARRLKDYEARHLAPVSAGAVPMEIEPLVNAINDLIGKLQDNQAAQRRFVANAAHQLRTPLAALQVQAQRALRERDPAMQREAIGDVHHSVSRLHHVAHQLLMLLRAEREGEAAIELVPVDLGAIAREALEAWTDAALSRSVDLGYDGPDEPVSIRADRHLLRELIDNLLDNAIRYGPHGGVITLSIERDPAALFVTDDGPGIAASERGLVLERFYRGPGTDSRGCGLGLAIANEIAARHGATLRVCDNPAGRGVRVGLVFPSGEAAKAQ